MILGLGNDVIDIARIEQTIERYGDRFLLRVFTEIERNKSDRRRQRGGLLCETLCRKGGLRKGAWYWHPARRLLARHRRREPSLRKTDNRTYGLAPRRDTERACADPATNPALI